MIDVSEIELTPTRALLLHRLNRGERLLRFPSTLRFVVGPQRGPYVTVNRLAAELLINHRLVDNHGPLGENARRETEFLINARGRAWCQAHPERTDES